MRTLLKWANSATAPNRTLPRGHTRQGVADAIVHATLQETPGATHWSCRSMAKAAGVSRPTIQRIRDAHGLQPRRVTMFELPKDPAFVEKLTDVVGPYLNPPDNVPLRSRGREEPDSGPRPHAAGPAGRCLVAQLLEKVNTCASHSWDTPLINWRAARRRRSCPSRRSPRTAGHRRPDTSSGRRSPAGRAGPPTARGRSPPPGPGTGCRRSRR